MARVILDGLLTSTVPKLAVVPRPFLRWGRGRVRANEGAWQVEVGR